MENITDIEVVKTELAKIMLAGFDKILGGILEDFRKQFKTFLVCMPESLTNAIEKAKEGI